MAPIDPRNPCIVGVGRRTWRPDDADRVDGLSPEPLAMWEHVVRAAADDAGASSGPTSVLTRLDRLDVVYCQSWQYDDPPRRLADSLGVAPRIGAYSGLGGTRPFELVAGIAEQILRGELDAGVVVGAEGLDTRKRIKAAGAKPQWSHRHPQPPPFPLEAPFLDTEIAHEVFQAWLTFATFDVGRRAHLGLEVDRHRRELGELFAPMTAVAAGSPHAWFPVARDAAELTTVTAGNRMVGFPYTKYLVSVMDVDMAAAVIVTSHGVADDLGVPADRRVYLRGWAYAEDPYHLAEHVTYHDSPAMAAAASSALAAAGTGVDDVAHLDLYSCFCSSVAFALDALGLAPDDPRGVTVTGGLPYHGGPGSNYGSHALAAMTEVLRADPGSYGLCSGVGMHMTKHQYTVLSTTPPTAPPTASDPDRRAALQRAVAAAGAPRRVSPTATGPATVATYSVVHGRDGAPSWALVLCDLPDGSRCYATAKDPELLAALEADEWVGRGITLVDGGDGRNLVSP